jgi:hypothetical protein
VGFYQDQLLPRMQDKVMSRKAMDEVRARTCAGLIGNVVEVGFGTGLNARYYPTEVTKIFAVEPSQVCMRLAEPRIARAQAPVEQAGLTGDTSTCRPRSSTQGCPRGRCVRFPILKWPSKNCDAS